MKLIIHTDGGARGNPGPAAIGVVIDRVAGANKTIELARFGKRIGETTNNVAEYTAVIEALAMVKRRWSSVKKEERIEIDFFLDSVLVVNQLNGTFRVKDGKLRELLIEVRTLEAEVGRAIAYRAVPREKNRRADFLVNRALDNF